MDYCQDQIVVHNQQELDAIPENYSGTILVDSSELKGADYLWVNNDYIDHENMIFSREKIRAIKHLNANFVFYSGPSHVFNTHKKIVVKGDAKRPAVVVLHKNCSCEIEVRGSGHVTSYYPVNDIVAKGNSSIEGRGGNGHIGIIHFDELHYCDSSFYKYLPNYEGLPKITLYDEATLTILKSEMDNTFIETHDNSIVKNLGGNRSIEAYDNSKIDAHENVVVTCYNNSKVSSYDNVEVMAYNNSEIMAYGGKIKIYDSVRFRKLGSADIIDNRSNR